MRRLIWLLALILPAVIPSAAHAEGPYRFEHARILTACGLSVRRGDGPAYTRLQCLSGQVVHLSGSGMKVRPLHGGTRRVAFTPATLFATDSGEGVLDGLVSEDYVCVGYQPRPGNVTAVVVYFDPRSLPCAPHRAGSSDDR